MDPLSLIVYELRRAEEEAAKYEKYLSRFEARSDFDACDELSVLSRHRDKQFIEWRARATHVPPHTMVTLSHNDLDLSDIACAEDTGPQCPRARPDAPDLLKYRADKAELSAIMRDFTNNKIHFVGIDDHTIVMPEYQTLRKAIKTGKDPAMFLKGEYRTYRTGYIKATNTYTENKLFFPYTLPASY
eukprot:gene11608-13490_t